MGFHLPGRFALACHLLLLFLTSLWVSPSSGIPSGPATPDRRILSSWFCRTDDLKSLVSTCSEPHPSPTGGSPSGRCLVAAAWPTAGGCGFHTPSESKRVRKIRNRAPPSILVSSVGSFKNITVNHFSGRGETAPPCGCFTSKQAKLLSLRPDFGQLQNPELRFQKTQLPLSGCWRDGAEVLQTGEKVFDV